MNNRLVEATVMSSGDALERELRAYNDNLPELVSSIGKFVVIHQDDVVGVYDTYEDALKVG